jgi:hypothetical protein
MALISAPRAAIIQHQTMPEHDEEIRSGWSFREIGQRVEGLSPKRRQSAESKAETEHTMSRK